MAFIFKSVRCESKDLGRVPGLQRKYPRQAWLPDMLHMHCIYCTHTHSCAPQALGKLHPWMHYSTLLSVMLSAQQMWGCNCSCSDSSVRHAGKQMAVVHRSNFELDFSATCVQVLACWGISEIDDIGACQEKESDDNLFTSSCEPRWSLCLGLDSPEGILFILHHYLTLNAAHTRTRPYPWRVLSVSLIGMLRRSLHRPELAASQDGGPLPPLQVHWGHSFSTSCHLTDWKLPQLIH